MGEQHRRPPTGWPERCPGSWSRWWAAPPARSPHPRPRPGRSRTSRRSRAESLEAARAAAGAGPAQDAHAAGRARRRRAPTGDFDEPPAETTFEVYGELIASLARAFDAARAGDQILYGFARHEVTTIHLGSSTGLRQRWVQPTGTLEVNAKSADLQPLGVGGAVHRRLRRRRRRGGVGRPGSPAGVGEALRRPGRRGATDTVLPPTSVADFMIYLAWSAASPVGARGPVGVLRAGRRHPGRASGSPSGRWRCTPTRPRAGSSARRSSSPRIRPTRSRCSTTARPSAGSTCCATA